MTMWSRDRVLREHYRASLRDLDRHEVRLERSARPAPRPPPRGDMKLVRQFDAEALPDAMRWTVACLRRMGFSTPEIAAMVMRVAHGHTDPPGKGWGGRVPENMSFGVRGEDGLFDCMRRPKDERPPPGIGVVGGPRVRRIFRLAGRDSTR